MRRTTTLFALVSLAVLTLGAGATSPARAAETCDGLVATIVVAATDAGGAPVVIGTAGDDVIVGSPGDDRIDGAEGNDTICGLGGGDRILGGEGDDRLFGGLDSYDGEDYSGDHIEPGPGRDHVDLGHDPTAEGLRWADLEWDQVSFAHATGPVRVDLTAGTATGEGIDTIAPIVAVGGVEGSAFDDHLTGSDEVDWITAGGGDDVIDGRDGNDRLLADDPTRRLPEQAMQVPGDDRVEGGAGDDEIEGGHGVDRLRGGRGRDAIRVTDAEEGTLASGGAATDTLGTWPSLSTGRARFVGGAAGDNFHPSIRSRRDQVTVNGSAGRNRLAPSMSLRAAPRGSKVLIDARSGRVRTRIGTPIRFSSVVTFDVVGSTETRLVWQGSRRSEILGLTEQQGPVRAFGRGGRDRLFGGTGRDLLDGGPDRDLIVGDKGRDRCLNGESVESCEVRR